MTTYHKGEDLYGLLPREAVERLTGAGWVKSEITDQIMEAVRNGVITLDAHSPSFFGDNSCISLPSGRRWRAIVNIDKSLATIPSKPKLSSRELEEKKDQIKRTIIVGENPPFEDLTSTIIACLTHPVVDLDASGIDVGKILLTEDALIYCGKSYKWNCGKAVISTFPDVVWHKISSLWLVYRELLSFLTFSWSEKWRDDDLYALIPDGYITITELWDNLLVALYGVGAAGPVDYVYKQGFTRGGEPIKANFPLAPEYYKKAYDLILVALKDGRLHAFLRDGDTVGRLNQREWYTALGQESLSKGKYKASIDMPLDGKIIYVEDEEAKALVKSVTPEIQTISEKELLDRIIKDMADPGVSYRTTEGKTAGKWAKFALEYFRYRANNPNAGPDKAMASIQGLYEKLHAGKHKDTMKKQLSGYLGRGWQDRYKVN
jgi:hypothetical protein